MLPLFGLLPGLPIGQTQSEATWGKEEDGEVIKKDLDRKEYI